MGGCQVEGWVLSRRMVAMYRDEWLSRGIVVSISRVMCGFVKDLLSEQRIRWLSRGLVDQRESWLTR